MKKGLLMLFYINGFYNENREAVKQFYKAR